MQTAANPTAAPRTEVSAPARRPIHALYAFDCPPEQMIRICRLLLARGYRGDSAAYVMPHKGRFYLTVEEQAPHSDVLLPPHLLLEEFGVRIAAASMQCCLGEHAKCICSHDAVSSIAALSM